ncbi:hypothetical protein OKA04_23675 [Luteolibacter flavescens]|uniref:Transmembrane protein n=1 Tax=Luteolibacter flavescens TaxID=1859460 RepID=A0ABT3FVY2_9BACT|nr:hypothetical protein [Luteolibacter flavescens]MCW1887758.1 hypothetical protein [Luteolibacter flavescens]
MKIDFGDVFASGVGWLLKQLFLFVASIWLGCTMGAPALNAANLADGGRFNGGMLLGSPMLLLTMWIIPNIFFLGAAVYWFVRNESNTIVACGILAGVESLVVVAGHVKDIDGWLPLSAAWATWIMLTGMLATGLWFLHQWQMNRWAIQIQELKAENAMRRVELKEKFGTDSAGVDETGMP